MAEPRAPTWLLAWPLEVSSCFSGGEHEQEGSLDLGSSACGSRNNPRTVALGWPFLQLPSASESAPALGHCCQDRTLGVVVQCLQVISTCPRQSQDISAAVGFQSFCESSVDVDAATEGVIPGTLGLRWMGREQITEIPLEMQRYILHTGNKVVSMKETRDCSGRQAVQGTQSRAWGLICQSSCGPI